MNEKKICVGTDQRTANVDDKDPKVVINSLDYDSLAKIFMLLPIPERIDMEEVCAKWKEASQLAWYDIKKYKCKSSIGRCYDNRLLTQSYLKEILLRCGNYLKELSLSGVCDSRIMSFVGDHCKNLTSLECEFDVNSLFINANHFVQAFTQLDKLKCIKILLSHTNKQKIAINLFEIINSLPEEMNEVHLFFQPRYVRKRNINMSVKKFKNLQKLTLVGLYLDNIVLEEIADITTLVHLNIRLYNDHIHRNLSLFDKLVNLEYINLTMRLEYEAKNLSTKVLETIFCTCKNLKHLDIPYGPYDVADIPLEKWMNFQNLQHLGISCNIMPDSVNTIVEYCKNLKHLRIHYPHRIMNDTAFKKLTELKNLECLILDGLISRLHDKSITAISNNCKNLKRLEIPDCFILDNKFSSSSNFDELSKLQYLEHLNLSYAQNLKDSTIIAIAYNCKNLKSLDIRNCRGLTETALVALTNLENLQKLNVSLLDVITDSFIIKLKKLKEFDCSHCNNLTTAGIIQFIKNNPDLEKITLYCIFNITIDLVIAADLATKNRTNGIILHIQISNQSVIDYASESIITSQWLVVVDEN